MCINMNIMHLKNQIWFLFFPGDVLGVKKKKTEDSVSPEHTWKLD